MPTSYSIQRVMIVGGPGSGKSTLAVQLGEITQLPIIHLDKIQYLSGWVERSKTETSLMIQKIHTKEQWIFEGGYSSTYPERLARADLFVWLDIPAWKRLYRVLRRSYTYNGKTRPDMHEGCPQRFNWQTINFLIYIIRTRKSERDELFEIYQTHPVNLRVIRLSNQPEIDRFLSCVAAKVRSQANGLIDQISGESIIHQENSL